MTKKMWEYKRPSVRHIHDKNSGEITEVEVIVGRKYYNIPYPNNSWSGYKRQFVKEPQYDTHGIPYHEEHSEYSTEYMLFETLGDAERYKAYDEIEARLRVKGMHDKIKFLPMDVLQLIEKCLDEKITDVLPAQCRKISVPLKDGLGELCAEVGGDMENYPEIYTYVRRPDGYEVDVAAVGSVSEDDFTGVKAYLYGDTRTEEYTDTFRLSKDELEVKFD